MFLILTIDSLYEPVLSGLLNYLEYNNRIWIKQICRSTSTTLFRD